MLEFRHYFKALRDLRVTTEQLSEFFGKSVSTISNWISGTRNPSLSLQEILEGTKKCRNSLRQNNDIFVHGLIQHLDIPKIEKVRLEKEYLATGYDAFIIKVVESCMYHQDFQSSTLEKQADDDREHFVQNFHKRLFWSCDNNITLEKLYIKNNYIVTMCSYHFNDVENIIGSFIDGNVQSFLMEKEISYYEDPCVLFITGYAGCGKTSLVSNLAANFAAKEHTRRLYFISFTNWKENVLSFNDIAQYLNETPDALRNSILIMDGLDEVSKSADYNRDILPDLIEELHKINCKAIITCRKNLLDANALRYCLEISLDEFTSEQAKQWLKVYYEAYPNFDLRQWENDINNLTQDLSRVVLTPLILYICVSRKIELSQVNSLGKLYDILFDRSSGVVPITAYRGQTNYREDEWRRLRAEVKRISLLMFQNGEVTQDDVRIANYDSVIDQLALDFYVDASAERILFEHASIWQYFVAEAYYEVLVEFDRAENEEQLFQSISDYCSLTKNCDGTILSFISHFILRDKWKPKNASLFQKLLLHSVNYPISRKGNQLNLRSSVLCDLLSLVNTVFKMFDRQSFKTLFQFYSAEPQKSILTGLSNLTSDSPFHNLNAYNFDDTAYDFFNFSLSSMYGCTMRNASLRCAHFRKAKLIGIYGRGSCFDGSDFYEAYLHTSDFTGCSFIGCNFRKASLRGSNFSDTVFDYSDLRNADLVKARFSGSLYKCKIDIQQTEWFSLSDILDHSLQVYDADDHLLSWEEIERQYELLHKMRYNTWKHYSQTRFSEGSTING